MSDLVHILAAQGPVGVWALGGPRKLSPVQGALFGSLSRQLLGAGFGMVTGCCTGADASAVNAGRGSQSLQVLSAFGPGGAGSGPASAVETVALHLKAGGPVRYLAGGPLSMSLQARLVCRTGAVASAASAGAVVAFTAGPCTGSRALAVHVAHRGLPVFAVSFGVPLADLPPLSTQGFWELGASLGANQSLAFWAQGGFRF